MQPALKQSTNLREKPQRKLSPAQQLIKQLVDESRYSQKGFWPREMKIAKKLFEQYNSKFLLWVSPPWNKKVPSLAYFIADYGKTYLNEQSKSEQYQFYLSASTDLTPEKQTISLSETKIGEDVLVNTKPKTLKDFLKMY